MIKRIRIRNFKSLRDVSVDLGPITVLVGRGGTGKSNFLEATMFLRDCLKMKERAFGDRSSRGSILCATASAPEAGKVRTIEFDVCLAVPGHTGDYTYSLSLGHHNNNLHFASERFSHGSSTVFEQVDGKWLAEPAIRPLPPPGGLGIELASGIPEVGRAYVMLTDGIGCYDFPGSVLTEKQHQAGAAGLRDDAANYLQCLENINRNLRNVTAQQEIVAALRCLKPPLEGLQIAVPVRDRVLVTLKDESSRAHVIFQLSQESEGFRRFLAHLIALNQVPPKVLITFEEPENGMHPGALKALAEQIKAFPDSGGGQVILTTHSPVLLDNFDPEQIRVVEMENLETRIGRVSPEQMEALREQLQSTGELLTVDPARLA